MNEKYILPLRMNDRLATELEAASQATGVNKSKLIRMSLSRLLADLNSTGRKENMRQFGEYYREIQ